MIKLNVLNCQQDFELKQSFCYNRALDDLKAFDFKFNFSNRYWAIYVF